MRKRIFLSLIILLLCLVAVFADTTIKIKVNVTKTGNLYTATVNSIDKTGVTVWCSSTSPYNGYNTISVNTVIVSGVPSGTKLYFKAADSSYTTEDGANSTILTLNSTGEKEISITTNSKWGIAEEARLYYLPRNVVNNNNAMVDLSSAKQMLASQFNEVFVNHTDSNLGIFRIREALMTETVGRGESSALSESITILIESLDDWTFINEYNSTRTTPFTLDAFCVEETLTYTYVNDNNKYTTIDASSAIKLDASSTLAVSHDAATFNKTGNRYELVLPYTYFHKGSGRYYPRYYRNADICLNIPEFGSGNEPGYYTTRLRVTIPAHYEVLANQVPTIIGAVSYDITIRGFLGIDASSSGTSSFYVLSMEDTYSMDLGISSNPAGGYVVAEARFALVDVYTGPEGTQNAQNVLPTRAQERYTVYLSPTTNYNDTTTSFMFIKMGSERQPRTNENTIYYTLSWEPADPDLANSSYDNQNRTNNKAYYMRPKYTYKQISSASSGHTGRDSYQVNWEMDNIIKLNLTTTSLNSSLDHQEGMYYSYIYFILVTDM